MDTTDQIRYNNLDLIYSNLCFSYLSNNTEQMRYYFEKFGDEYPEYLGQMKLCIDCVFSENMCIPGDKTSIQNISGNILRLNINGCIRAIEKALREHSFNIFSLGAIQTIYYTQKRFTPTDVLYTAEYPSSYKESKSLTVSDLVSVADYSIKILNAINHNEKTQEISDALTVFKSLNLVLNNNSQDKPIGKALHIANSVLSSTIKRSLDDTPNKQYVGTMSVLIDLAIDFFCKK